VKNAQWGSFRKKWGNSAKNATLKTFNTQMKLAKQHAKCVERNSWEKKRLEISGTRNTFLHPDVVNQMNPIDPSFRCGFNVVIFNLFIFIILLKNYAQQVIMDMVQ
jgi:hypothetical protein